MSQKEMKKACVSYEVEVSKLGWRAGNGHLTVEVKESFFEVVSIII